MELETAIRLITKGVNKTAATQVWADLGSGTGLFTNALASLLKEGSIIFAIDKDLAALQKIDRLHAAVKIEIIQKDFSKDIIMADPLDGILMANALHYISDPLLFLKRIKTNLKSGGNFILVEYNLSASNQWVPYPIPYKVLTKLAKEVGFDLVMQLEETPSVYHRANIYSALLR